MSATRDKQRKRFGWLIAGALAGALIDFLAAYTPSDTEHNLRAAREARLKTAEKRIPFVVAGTMLGALLGAWAERRF